PLRLPDELVNLGMCGEVDDEVDVGVLDPVDSTGERSVVAREVLEQIGEPVRPGVDALVHPEDLVTVAKQPQGEVRADLARGSCKQNLHARYEPVKGTASSG